MTANTLVRIKLMFSLIFFCNINYAHKYHSAEKTRDFRFTTQERALKKKLKHSRQIVQNTANLMRLYISQGNKTKKGIYFDKGIEVYRHFIKTHDFSAQPTLLGAYLYQKVHRFKPALGELDKLISRQPSSTNAWMMKAQIELTLGKLSTANISCKKLWGLRKQLFATTCQSAVISMQGKPALAYKILSQQVNFDRFDKTTRKSTNHHTQSRISTLDPAWPVEVLTDIAIQLNDTKIINNLFKRALKLYPQSYYLVINYADYLLSKNQHKRAYRILKNKKLSDPILLRLLRVSADIRSPQKKRLIARTLQQFKKEFKTGVKLGHHREISYYHYYITKNYAAAYKHARLNWVLQKELIDLRLLANSAAKLNLLAQAQRIAHPFKLGLIR